MRYARESRNHHCTPVHGFHVRYPTGELRWKVTPGTFCDITICRDRVTARLPEGAVILTSSWRSDYDFITAPGNLQPDYGA